jgi:hypothetical protein
VINLFVNEAFGVLTGLHDVAGRRASEVALGSLGADTGSLRAYGRVAAGGHPERFEVFFE